MIAALFVETDGCYFNLADVDPWDKTRDARLYRGPHPVVAHPPCQRWGRFWHGSPSKPHQFKLGEDGGCFAAALTAVRNYGGVLEHPKDSEAWDFFGIMKPFAGGGWMQADAFGGWTCCIDQGRYGHSANKRTWLYAAHADLPSLIWGKGRQRLDAKTLAERGYEIARRRGMISAVGGGGNPDPRNATPTAFRDLLISIAQTAKRSEAA